MKHTKVQLTSSRNGSVLCDLNLLMHENDSERITGLRGVPELPEGVDGMIFDFERSAPQSMTMRGCEMPLVFLFVNEHMQVRQISDRVDPNAFSPPIISSQMDVRYVIEMNTTAALQSRVGVNDTIAFIEE